MRDATAFVLAALVAAVAWCLHRWITTWGEVRKAQRLVPGMGTAPSG